MKARRGTEVLSAYLGGAPGAEYPAVTARKSGKGWALIFPRVRHWPEVLSEMEGLRLPRPELRGLQLGRQYRLYNGVSCAIHLRRLLEHVGALPEARLVRAPVSASFLDEQAKWMMETGIPREEVEHSEKMVRESQTGFPMLARSELMFLARSGIDLDAFAPVRVSMLSGKKGGKAVFAINFTSLPRVAEIALPPCNSVVDVLNGDEIMVNSGGVKVNLKPYQSRVLALFN